MVIEGGEKKKEEEEEEEAAGGNKMESEEEEREEIRLAWCRRKRKEGRKDILDLFHTLFLMIQFFRLFPLTPASSRSLPSIHPSLLYSYLHFFSPSSLYPYPSPPISITGVVICATSTTGPQLSSSLNQRATGTSRTGRHLKGRKVGDKGGR